MRYPPSLLDEIRARLPVSQVVGRSVPLKRKGREFAGLSPFKDEKTPSFFVNDQKGFYHCFASGEHGDIFKFLMTTQGLSFPEAVSRLAEEAGVALPKLERVDPKVEEQRDRWHRLLDTTAEFFVASLYSAQGRACLSYLQEKRGLSPATLETFQIGYAPNSRTALKDHLAKNGFTPAEMATMGVLIAGDDIPQPYDRFRNRAIFPIHDIKGRVIAFGGRALAEDQPAKYLNSPETPLFHKGHQLYNAHRARKPSYDNSRILVVEGYMDVVALAQVGIMEAVAPLGTALTENQIKLLWRYTDEPTLCFDGDSAGKKAAHRAIDTAIHMLAPGQSLKFAFLPDGQDPDDLIKEGGSEAIEAVISATKPFADIFFDREWQSGTWDTPERRAQLERQLGTLIARIEHQDVRTHYQRNIKDRLYQAWSKSRNFRQTANRSAERYPSTPSRSGQTQNGASRATMSGSYTAPAQSRRQSGPQGRSRTPWLEPQRTASLIHSRMVTGTIAAPSMRETLLIKALINHPWLIDEYSEDIARLEIASPKLANLKKALLSAHAAQNSLDTDTLRSHLKSKGLVSDLDFIDKAATHRCDRFAEPDTEPQDVELGWSHALKLQDRHLSLQNALATAERAWHDTKDEAAFARIQEIKSELAESALSYED
ncbi:MAG: DNA primase [Pseudomonadota bacterium]